MLKGDVGVNSTDNAYASKNIFKNANEKFPFGKYKGQRLIEIIKSDWNYVEWCLFNLNSFTITHSTISELKEIILNHRFRGRAVEIMLDRASKYDNRNYINEAEFDPGSAYSDAETKSYNDEGINDMIREGWMPDYFN